MNILILVSQQPLGALWSRHLRRHGAEVKLAKTHEDAIAYLHKECVDLVILELDHHQAAPLAVSDFASYRQPEAKVIFVTSQNFFSDGSIFQFCANACAFLPSSIPPDDLVALAEHHAAR
ncbi:MAG: hypothetical protein MK098_04050 [Marinovum sp.]|nr:hypothetical protein [Marinovum sp.]